jgi:hypothetical protein
MGRRPKFPESPVRAQRRPTGEPRRSRIMKVPRLTLAIVALLAIAGSTAWASHDVLITAGTVSFKDSEDSKKAVATMGIDVSCDGNPTVLLTDKGKGALGDATVPGYSVDDLPTDALARIAADDAARWVGVVVAYPGGVTFKIDTMQPMRLLATTMNRLEAVGCRLGTHAVGSNAFEFMSGDATYRAVFNGAEGGTLVYLGR